MGIVYSYFSENHEQRIIRLEKVVETMAMQIKSLENAARIHNEQQSTFEVDYGVFLRDPMKVESVQTSNNTTDEFNQEVENFENEEALMKAKGFKTIEELSAYVDLHRVYTFNIVHDGHYYQKLYTHKVDADAFRKRLEDWMQQGRK